MFPFKKLLCEERGAESGQKFIKLEWNQLYFVPGCSFTGLFLMLTQSFLQMHHSKSPDFPVTPVQKDIFC